MTEQTATSSGHWTKRVQEIVLSFSADSDCPFVVAGGSENAPFPIVSCLRNDLLTYLNENDRISNGYIVLEVQGRKMAGLTSYDAQKWLRNCCVRG
ncbi:unnamed protein product [Soboliphyme baturini]|uniref:Ras-associating domain-containing protein n=1 Tax=Soboliphyme baturini TaxID=241478 RepID=A0A183JAI9_9BILA|nr:unnamed protein product [Soboliphyme baturini]